MKVSVILPTYNEADNIVPLIETLRRLIQPPWQYEFVVVDDNSPDGTATVVQGLRQRHSSPRLFVEMRPGKLGLGSAYVYGLGWGLARGHDFLIQMDGDGSHDPGYLATMLKLAEEVDFVVGSRYVPGGSTSNWGLGRRLLSRFGSTYARLALGVAISDFTGGFNGWRACVLHDIGLESTRSDGYSFQIEVKYRAHRLGYSHAEFPIRFCERRGGKSKMSASIALEACWRVWDLRLGRASTRGGSRR